MYPQELEYKHSVENRKFPPNSTGLNFIPILNGNNEVISSLGGRSVVFKVKDINTNNYFALKFFTFEDENRYTRYSEISNYLKNVII